MPFPFSKPKPPKQGECEIDGCSYHPAWEVRTAGRPSRLSCAHHLTDVIELGVSNLLIPIDAHDLVRVRPFLAPALQLVQTAA